MKLMAALTAPTTNSPRMWRELLIESQGFRIIRAHNSETYGNLDGVCDTLLNLILPKSSVPSCDTLALSSRIGHFYPLSPF